MAQPSPLTIRPYRTVGGDHPAGKWPRSRCVFLAFEEIDGQLDGTTDPAIGAFSYSYQDAEQIQIGMRTFDEINQSFSWITGVPIDSPTVSPTTLKTVSETFDTVKRSLPSTADFQTFMASHQMAVMQLAAAYCDALVEDSVLSAAFFEDGTAFNMTAAVNTVSDPDWESKVVIPLIDRAYAQA